MSGLCATPREGRMRWYVVVVCGGQCRFRRGLADPSLADLKYTRLSDGQSQEHLNKSRQASDVAADQKVPC